MSGRKSGSKKNSNVASHGLVADQPGTSSPATRQRNLQASARNSHKRKTPDKPPQPDFEEAAEFEPVLKNFRQVASSFLFDSNRSKQEAREFVESRMGTRKIAAKDIPETEAILDWADMQHDREPDDVDSGPFLHSLPDALLDILAKFLGLAPLDSRGLSDDLIRADFVNSARVLLHQWSPRPAHLPSAAAAFKNPAHDMRPSGGEAPLAQPRPSGTVSRDNAHDGRLLGGETGAAAPQLTKALHLLSPRDLRPFLSEKRINAIYLLGSLDAKALEDHERRINRLAKMEALRMGVSAIDISNQYHFQQPFSFCIHYDDTGPRLPIIDLSNAWGKLVRDGHRLTDPDQECHGTAHWRIALRNQWNLFEAQLASNSALASPLVISDLQGAVVAQFKERQPLIDLEFTDLPEIRDRYRAQATTLSGFFSDCMRRITSSNSGSASGAFSLGLSDAGQQRESIITYNTCVGNMMRPFFADGTSARPRHDGPPRDGTFGGLAPAIASFAPPPPTYYPSPNPYVHVHTVQHPPPAASYPPSQPNPLSAARTQTSLHLTEEGGRGHTNAHGGWGPPGSLFKPMSSAIVGAQLGVLRRAGPTHYQCNSCPIAGEAHRLWECPLAYARAFGEACPGFDASGNHLPGAWEGDNLTDVTRQAWGAYISRHHIPASPTEEQIGGVPFTSV